jgi:hypothetical protein
MRSGLEGVDHAAARRFAIKNGIVGAGWGLNDLPKASQPPDLSSDLNLYLQRAKLRFPNDNSLEGVADIFGNQMQVGDFCWLYVTHTGEYWCCRIDGGFEYRAGGNFDAYDLHLTRRCTWVKAGPADAVPGVVRRAFAGQFGTISSIKTDAAAAVEAAEILFKLRQPIPNADLFAVATPEDLEDVVALYLQEQGWRVLPSTAKVSMASYEFVLVHHETGRRAGVQVKSGKVGSLNQAVAEDFDTFFVFMANPTAVVVGADSRLTRIGRDEIEAFARRCWALLPTRLQARWPNPTVT